MLLLSIAGLAISLYLTASHWSGQPIACGGVGSCDYVNTSEYAAIGQLPVSALGAGLYAALLFASGWWLIEGDERAELLAWGLSLAGVGYAAYLTYLELFVLYAVCLWCLASGLILVAMLCLTSLAVFSRNE
jgi:uncharacterized membrane protein